MSKPIICLTGFSGSGKSTLSRLLRKRFGLVAFKIGRYLELVAKEQNTPFNEFLKKVKSGGKHNTISVLAPKLNQAQAKGSGILVEGINSANELNELKRLFPSSPVFLFSIEAPFQTRVDRVKHRIKGSRKDAESYVRKREKDRAALGLDNVGAFCDGVVINNFSNERELVEEFEKIFSNTLKQKLINSLKFRIKKFPRKKQIRRK